MALVLPQEVLDLIVDEVDASYAPMTSYHPKLFLALLQAGPCFGPRCRKYIYREIKLALEKPPRRRSRLLTLSESSRRFFDIIRNMPSLGKLVKEVIYLVHHWTVSHNPDEMVETPAWQGLIELKQHLVNVDHVTFDFSPPAHVFPDTILFKGFIRPMAIILPSSSFTKLSIKGVEMHPPYLLDVISHCPTVTALTLADIDDAMYYFGDDPPDPVLSNLPPTITKLSLYHVETFVDSIQPNHFSSFKNVFSGVRRLVLLHLDLSSDKTRGRIRDIIACMDHLDEVYVSAQYNADDGLMVPEVVHAHSLCIVVADVSILLRLLSMLKATSKRTTRLERLAVVVHAYPSEPAINSLWPCLASALCQPRFSALRTVCITFNELHVVEDKLDVVRRSFHDSDFGDKVTIRIRRMPIHGELHLDYKRMY